MRLVRMIQHPPFMHHSCGRLPGSFAAVEAPVSAGPPEPRTDPVRQAVALALFFSGLQMLMCLVSGISHNASMKQTAGTRIG